MPSLTTYGPLDGMLDKPQQDLHKVILDQLSDAVLLHSSEGIVFANTATGRLLGLDRDLLLGRQYEEFVPAGELVEARARIAALLQGGECLPPLRRSLVRPDGTVLKVEVYATPLTYEGIRLAQVVIRDIAARLAAEETLREREVLLHHGAAMAKLGYWAWDLVTDRPTLCSEELARIHEVSVEAYLATYDRHAKHVEICHPEDRQRYDQAVCQSRDSGWPLDISYRLLLPSGTLRYVREIGEYVRDETGRVVRSFGVLQDITEQSLREQALIAARDRIERQAEDLRANTEKLDRALQQAQQARYEAEQANRSKSEFLAMMSHELRTPLNAIIGFSDLIAQMPADSSQSMTHREYAEHINEAGRHLLSLINDILDLSKIEAGRMEIQPEVLAAQELARACLNLAGGQAASYGVNLEVDLPLGDFHFVADERATKQMVVNLLSNAIKFSGRGEKVVLSLRPEAEGGAVLEVRDRGQGMTREQVRTALQPFAQVANVMTRQHTGTGLGLPIVSGLVELHGGRLEIDSTLGQGTGVAIHLPARSPATPRREDDQGQGGTLESQRS